MEPGTIFLAGFLALLAWAERNNVTLPVAKRIWKCWLHNRPGAQTHRELALILGKLNKTDEVTTKLDTIHVLLDRLEKMLAFNIAKKTLLENHVRAATFMTDKDGDYLNCSLEYQRIVGMSDEQLRGSGWKNAILQKDLVRWEALRQEAIQDGRPYFGETVFVNRETELHTCVAVHADPVKCNGKVIGFVGGVTKIKCLP